MKYIRPSRMSVVGSKCGGGTSYADIILAYYDDAINPTYQE
jgi:hypothetical protein